MESTKIFAKIKRDKSYLLKTYVIDMGVMLLCAFLLLNFKLTLKMNPSLVAIMVIVILGIINGLLVSSFLHNTSHGNIKNKIINRIIGEYCGYWVLYGFSNFVLVHMLHHQYSDKDLDPVNPRGMPFLTFLLAPMRYMIKTTKIFLNKVHGNKSNYALIMQAQIIVFHLNLLLRLGIWYLLLGKTLFFSFYLPGFFTIVTIFAHINYTCHKDLHDGTVQIVNLNHNLYYKIANFFTMGGYFHYNHHLNLKVFNPQKLS